MHSAMFESSSAALPVVSLDTTGGAPVFTPSESTAFPAAAPVRVVDPLHYVVQQEAGSARDAVVATECGSVAVNDRPR